MPCCITGKCTLSLSVLAKELSWRTQFLCDTTLSWLLATHSDGWNLPLQGSVICTEQDKLIWQTPWVTNAYNCHRLVKDFINGEFFQVQPHETSWGFIPLGVNAGLCRPNGHQGAKQYFFSPIQTPPRPMTSKAKATYSQDPMRRIKKSTFREWHHQHWVSGGYLFIMW